VPLQLLDELLKEEHVMDVIGCLEYDPDLQTPQQHRQFLSTAVVFKEVVPITSQEVLSKIHQTYRIQYLKDVILPRRWVCRPLLRLPRLQLLAALELHRSWR
jgi:protein phosphatase-4 regulatory subunit 3